MREAVEEGRGRVGDEDWGRTEKYAAYHTSRNKYTLYKECTKQKVGTNTAEQGRSGEQKDR